jgi:hypothetical protein
MKLKTSKTLCLLVLVVAAVQAAAATPAAETRNDVSSCRTPLKLEPMPPTREYTVLIDQTTQFSPALAQDAIDRIQRSLKAGDHVRIVSFSGLNAAHFLFTEFDGRFEVPATESERDTVIPAPLLGKAAACFTRQAALARKKIGETLSRLLGKPLEHSPGRSEILKAVVASAAAQSVGASDNILILVSDGVEHNDVLSFYGKHGLNVPPADAALAVVKQHNLLADLHGVRVFMIGAAYSTDPKRAPGLQAREKLQQFWQRYVTDSNGRLVGYGEPALLADIL